VLGQAGGYKMVKRIFFLILLSLVHFHSSSAASNKKKRQKRPLDDVSYETIFSLCEGTLNIPVIDRTTAQKSAYIRFWRNKEHFTVNTVNEKKVL